MNDLPRELAWKLWWALPVDTRQAIWDSDMTLTQKEREFLSLVAMSGGRGKVYEGPVIGWVRG